MFNKLFKTLLLTVLVSSFNSSAFADANISVDFWDDGAVMGIKLDKATATAGKITFKANNKSAYYEHEMLIVKVENYSDALPYNVKERRVEEDKVNAVGEISETKSGQSAEKTFDLAPGKYLLLCNVEGHYEMGMFTAFMVTK